MCNLSICQLLKCFSFFLLPARVLAPQVARTLFRVYNCALSNLRELRLYYCSCFFNLYCLTEWFVQSAFWNAFRNIPLISSLLFPLAPSIKLSRIAPRSIRRCVLIFLSSMFTCLLSFFSYFAFNHWLYLL